ncbi:MAG: type II toxin-antitoxin system RelE/ParE family toxin [Planctomycetota bacterium]
MSIQWTETAKRLLKKLPKDVQRGLLEKADLLYECHDPRAVHKPLVGPLKNCYRLTFGRYRAVYTVEEDELATGDVLRHIRVWFIAAGIRKEQSRHDVYEVARKIVEMGVIDLGGAA